MNRPWIIGIDPGLKGAIAIYDHKLKQLVSVADMPVMKGRSNDKNWLDAPTLAGSLQDDSAKVLLAVIEQPSAMPNDGPVQAFRFGHACGMVEGIMAGFGIPVYLVKPSVWKSMVGLSSDKDLSRKMAIQKFPGASKSFARKMDDGRAEAALLSLFGAVNFAKMQENEPEVSDLF